jgi:hypothetical protein
MSTVITISKWLATTRLSEAVRGGVPWIWPASETLHFIGLCLLLGVIGTMDLRLMGFVKGLAIGRLERMVPWGIAGFVLCAVTGVLFYIGAPDQYYTNNIFWMKMLFIAAAGINVLVFYVSGIARLVDHLPPDADTPVGARVIGATSVVLWLGVVFWGRMLPFLGGAF